jgi:TatA/E family protein of Tat protein translocase
VFLGEIFGPDLLVVVVVIAVVLFGGASIPKLARSLGQAKSEFRSGLSSISVNAGTGDDPAAPNASTK